MNFEKLLQREKYILSQGSVYELLRRSPEVTFDKNIYHASLIYDEASAKVMERVFRSYIDTAVASSLSISISTATWRASRERVQTSDFSNRAVNEDNVRFLRDIRDSYSNSGISIMIEGDIGPGGDAYKPGEALDINSAQGFHKYQIEALAASGVDYLQASTLPALSEALGIALVMARTGLPYMISFVVDESGCLLDGTKLSEAIFRIDNEVGDSQARYSINCVHPTILHRALDKNPEVKGRITSFAGNTSDLTTDELDGLQVLQTQEPNDFALANKQLLEAHHIQIVGACCGSGPEHIQKLSDVLNGLKS
ncbi:MAG: homocysteine S-methyltransferase family protein [Proteobacteria bacterium]|nr:homocysteine S-methyltransferase family protein [Pseudomonadota bacterium]